MYRTLSSYTYGSGAEYALGAVVQVDGLNWKDGATWPTTRTTNSYIWRDGAVSSGIVYDGDSNNPNNALWITNYGYEIIGGQAQMRAASIADGRPRTVSFVSDFLGQVIRRDEKDNLSGGDPHETVPGFPGASRG